MVSSLELIPLLGLPMVEPGDDIARLIADGISANGLSLVEGDVVESPRRSSPRLKIATGCSARW